MRAWGFLLTALLAGPAAATDYVVLTSGEPSGTMSVTGGATREIAFSLNDRGRGPDVRSSVTTDPQQLITQLSTKGVNYSKAPVDERFARDGGEGVWQAANDRGRVAQPGFYYPDEQTPEHLALLARALLANGGRPLALLPAGTAQLAKLDETQVQLDGRSVRASLYIISGLNFGPSPLWLDEQNELLMQGGGWTITVRRGLEGQARQLQTRQQEAIAQAARARTPELMRRPAGPVLFQNVRLFNPRNRATREGQDILVEGDRIAWVAPTGRRPAPRGAQVVAGEGRTILPGLWDMHVHLGNATDGLLHIAAGVTSVRDMASDADDLTRLRAKFDAAELVGPRVIPAGFIDGSGALSGPIKVLADTPDQLRKAIAGYADRGYPQIKLYSSLKPELVPVAAQEARRRGMRLSGHIPAGMTARAAVEAGYDEVTHLNYIALNFMGPEINAKTNGITRLTIIGERAWQLDPGSADSREFIRFLRDRKTVVEPTFQLYEASLMGRPGAPRPTLAAVIDRLPPVFRRGVYGSSQSNSLADFERNVRSYRVMQGFLKGLHDGGVRLLIGTDGTPGFTLHRELELWVEAGIPAPEVLRIATLGAAEVAGQQARLGTVEAGKLADLVLVDGQPDRDIRAVRKPVVVMKGGWLIDPKTINREIGVAD